MHNQDNVEIAVLRPGESLSPESWVFGKSYPGNGLVFRNNFPDGENARFEIIDNRLCSVIYMPIMGKNYNPDTSKMELRNVGFLIAAQKIGSDFAKRISSLTGTEINIFGKSGLLSGTKNSYAQINLGKYNSDKQETMLMARTVIYEDTRLDGEGYFQGLLPIYTSGECVAAIVALYSKKIARANAMQIIELFSFLYLLFIILVVPFVVLWFVRWVVNPIRDSVRLMQDVTRNKDFDKTLTVNSNDEVGQLASAFNVMIKELKNSTTSIDNLNREIAERKKTENELNNRIMLEFIIADISARFINVKRNSLDMEINSSLRRVGEFLGVDRAYIFLFRDQSLELADNTHEWCSPGVGPQIGSLKAVRMQDEVPEVFKHMINGEIFYFDEADKSQELTEGEKEHFLRQGIKSLIAVPITQGKNLNLIGLLGFDAVKKKLVWNEGVVTVMKILADVFSSALERISKEEELKSAYEKLQQTQSKLMQTSKMAAIGQLASGVAHEINNPLTGVLNNVQLIKLMGAKDKALSGSEFKDLLDVIEHSAMRCKKITQSLLDFSHVSRGTLKNICINEMIKKVCDIIEHEMKLQNITMEKALQPDLPLVKAEPQLLQQVIFDLITNAKWAIHKKGENNGCITLKTSSDDALRRVNLIISDNGVGISQANIERIFEPFFTTKDVGEGTGLGLSIVYNIVREHGGNIEVRSTEGEGASFTISFPVSS